MANANSFSYRGYYYDIETGLYYVSSRYYDPEVCRFINADDQLSTGIDLTGMNLFAYCGNNPITRVDPTGHAWWHWALAAVVVVACAVATIATAGGFVAGMAAVVAVGNGVAAATTALTVSAAAFIGSATYLGMSAMNVAASSSSVSDFCDQGNWGTVAGTAGSAVLAGGSASLSTRGSTPSKSVPNPNGKKGGAAHQTEIAKQTAKFEPAQVKFEVKINTPGGMKPYRYADFSITQNGQTWYGNVGRQLQSGLPCARERYAISDIQGAGGTIYFFPYN